jgi:hypothetical protein
LVTGRLEKNRTTKGKNGVEVVVTNILGDARDKQTVAALPSVPLDIGGIVFWRVYPPGWSYSKPIHFIFKGACQL